MEAWKCAPGVHASPPISAFFFIKKSIFLSRYDIKWLKRKGKK